MTPDKLSDLQAILDSFSSRPIIVLGDIMLDAYLWGKVQRISPEAPVPVVEISKEEYRLGGAANAALNLAAMGAQVELIGVCGKDSEAKIVHKLLKQSKLSPSGIFTDPARPTSLKTRIGAASQQIVRMDRESSSHISEALRQEIINYLEQTISCCDAILIEDYDKGVLSKPLIDSVLSLARQHNIPVAVDPKQKNFSFYTGVDIFKPNYRELEGCLNETFSTDQHFFTAAETLRKKLKAKHLVVTRGSKGMAIFSGSDVPRHLPTFARDVYDVSGAGDTVISALTLAYLYSHEIELSALIANHAAAVVVAKHGTAAATTQEVWESYNDSI